MPATHAEPAALDRRRVPQTKLIVPSLAFGSKGTARAGRPPTAFLSAPAGHDHGAVCPMSGKVVKVLVKNGQSVKKGCVNVAVQRVPSRSHGRCASALRWWPWRR
jgi:biotin carboxyl carrier protein